ncbi:MAG: arginase, partial [Clostridiales bacterium]|nr:arginase [Clostridiales bacterium]
MKKCLLSVDWDYFIFTRDNWGSYIENKKCLIDLWYKKYIQAKARGEEIMEAYRLTSELDGFWRRIRKQFGIAGDTKVYVSESHALSYKIAKENNCSSVYLFDSHADLGYGGLSSLNFEINCSN